MKILHLTDSFQNSLFRGGSLDFVNSLTRYQVSQGHEVAVVTESMAAGEPSGAPEDIAIYRLPFSEAAISADLGWIRRITAQYVDIKRHFQADVVHVHLNNVTAWFEALGKDSPAIPSVLTVHPPVGHITYMGDLLKRIFLSSTRVVAVSRAQKNDIDLLFGLPDRTQVIYNGIPEYGITPAALPSSPATLLCLGRMNKSKGFAVAIESFARLVQEMPGVLRMIVAGEGPELSDLQALAVNLGLTEQEIVFKGWVDGKDIPALINSCSMVLVPSVWKEPFGLVSVQAAQLARPVIASETGGIPEVVLHGVTGILVPAGDSLALEKAIKELMIHPELATALGKSARERAKEHFTLATCAAKYDALYASLLDECIPAPPRELIEKANGSR